MASKLKKIIYAAALPLAFATSLSGQNFDSKSLDSFFSSSGKTTKITEAYYNIVQEKSKVQTKVYDLKLCQKSTAEEDNFSLRYMAYNWRWGRAQFFLTNKNLEDDKGQSVVGGFSVKASTNTIEDDLYDPQKELGHSNLKTSSSDHRTIRTYDLFLNRLYESDGKKNCIDITVLMKEEKKGTFGDFLPKN